MMPPQPMLSTWARRWPDGGRWVLQPKWDGFRLLLQVGDGGEVRAWSRHGTNLTARLGSLLAPFIDVAPGTTFDGELVAVSERDGKPAQDFAAVTRAVFTGHAAATQRLRLVAFDVLLAAGQDMRPLRLGGAGRAATRDPSGQRPDPPRRLTAGDARRAPRDRRPGVRGHGAETRGSAYRPGRTPHMDQTQKARSPLGGWAASVQQDARAAGTPSASSMAAVCTPLASPRTRRMGSGSPSSWSTRASTPTAPCGKPASRPHRDGSPSRRTCRARRTSAATRATRRRGRGRRLRRMRAHRDGTDGSHLGGRPTAPARRPGAAIRPSWRRCARPLPLAGPS